MEKQIHIDKVKELFEKSPVVDFKSIQRIVRAGKTRGNYAKLLVSNLLKRNYIKKIGKCIYTKHNESSLSVFAFKPAYLGLQCALSHFGIWEQETIPIILTTKKVRRGIRKIMGSNVLIRNIDKKHFFGFDFVKEGDFYMPYSDLEKTFIDMIVFNQKIDLIVLNKIKKEINKKRLNSYLKNYSPKIKKMILKKLWA